MAELDEIFKNKLYDNPGIEITNFEWIHDAANYALISFNWDLQSIFSQEEWEQLQANYNYLNFDIFQTAGALEKSKDYSGETFNHAADDEDDGDDETHPLYFSKQAYDNEPRTRVWLKI